MIIVYRNRLTKDQRNNILAINKKKFVLIRDIVSVRISIFKKGLNPEIKA